jgi:hypothetical protein
LKTIDQFNAKLESMNARLDVWLIEFGVKKRPILPFEQKLHVFIQSFLLNLSCDMTLEEAMRRSIYHSSNNERLMHHLTINQNAIVALNQYAIEIDFPALWRFSRLVNQCYITGGTHLYSTLERFHDELWTQKFSDIKKHSERVSVQLTFLLTLSLISVIIVVMAPVMQML